MKKYIVLILFFLLLPVSASNAVDAPCTKSQAGKIKNKLVCTKVTRYRYAWIEPKPTVKPTSAPTIEAAPISDKKYFENPCHLDPMTPENWKDLEKFSSGKCLGPLRIPSTKESTQTPTIALNKNEISLSECKIAQNINKLNTLAFHKQPDRLKYFNNMRHPSPNTVYHVIGLYSKDIPKPNTNPKDDYKDYIDFISEYTKAASDTASNIKFKINNEYLFFPENMAKYNLIHERSQADANIFNNDFAKYIDPQIDFRGSNIVIIVFPPENKIISEQVGLGRMPIAEQELVGSIMTHWKNYSKNNFAIPMWWMHQLNHVSLGFDDNNSIDKDGPMAWGLMSKLSVYDLLVWHKWLAGFISDNQVLCLNNNLSSTVMISPSTVKSNKAKMALIPISNTKIIVIESQRSEGVNYKMPKISEGVLVYLIDTNLTNSHDGIRLVLPQNKKMIDDNSNATLKLNEHAVYQNYKISVIESGDFGDIVSIIKL
jgi:hypothetical protein